jgi:hypothetical protein
MSTFPDAIHGMGFFSRPAEVVPTVPREKTRDEQLAEIDAELGVKQRALVEARARLCQHNNTAKRHNVGKDPTFFQGTKAYVGLNAASQDPVGERLAGVVDSAKRQRDAVLDRRADILVPRWRVQ